jgi:predicted PurR-regulated permease PerM
MAGGIERSGGNASEGSLTNQVTTPPGERQFIRRVLIVLALASLFFIAWHLRGVIMMLFGAVVVASVFRALADILRKRLRLPDPVAVAGAVLIVLAVLVGLGALFGSHIAQQVETLRTTLPKAWESFEARIGEWGLGEALSQGVTGGSAFANVGRTLISVGSGLADTLVVIFGGIFIAAQPNFYRHGAIKLIPPGKRALVTDAIIDSERALRLWLKGQLIAMVLVGLLTGIGLWALGMRSAMVLGLLAGVLEFIPFAGPILAGIPAVLLALAVSPDLALWVLLLYVAVQQVEGAILQPLVQQYAVDLPGVILLFALIAFGTLFGAIGVVLAAPLAVVSYVMVKRLYIREALDTETPIPGER